MKKALYTITTIVIIALIGFGIYYWFFYSKVPPQNNDGNNVDTGFNPLTNGGLPGNTDNQTGNNNNVDNTDNNQTNNAEFKLPKLRQISSVKIYRSCLGFIHEIF